MNHAYSSKRKVTASMDKNDLLRQVDHFPLGSPMEASSSDEDGVIIPFGLRYATMPNNAAIFEPDFAKISYDTETQTAVVTEDDGSIIQAGRHTSTKTTTSTSRDDRKGSSDKDTDAAGD